MVKKKKRKPMEKNKNRTNRRKKQKVGQNGFDEEFVPNCIKCLFNGNGRLKWKKFLVIVKAIVL